ARAGVVPALCAAAALPGRPRGAPGGRRPAAMGLFGALDDLGLTLGPALAALLLFVLPTDGLLALNAISFAVSGLAIATTPTAGQEAAVERGPSLLAEARAGIRELAGRPEVRALI